MPKEVIAVPESAVRLRVNGHVVAAWTCTPLALDALAAGRLLAEGFLRSPGEILALRILPEKNGALDVGVEIPEARMAEAMAHRDHITEHGCGPRFLVDCRPELIRRARAGSVPDQATFQGLFRELFAAAETYRSTGGLHTAALSDGSSLSYLHEEVSRHNAVQKAFGEAILDDADPRAFGLVTTARISGLIAASAARAGVAWIASRSVPTTLAVEIAAVAGIPIIGRAPSPDARVFSP